MPSYDKLTQAQRRKSMSRVRNKNTTAEKTARQLFHAWGYRFRLKNTDLPGSPDFAYRARRWAVFVHGCFWHGHQGSKRAGTPNTNRAFWTKKLEKNRLRDEHVLRLLRDIDFTTVVIWQCELKYTMSLAH